MRGDLEEVLKQYLFRAAFPLVPSETLIEHDWLQAEERPRVNGMVRELIRYKFAVKTSAWTNETGNRFFREIVRT